LGLFGVVAVAQPPSSINENLQPRNGLPVGGTTPAPLGNGSAAVRDPVTGDRTPIFGNGSVGPAPIIGSNPAVNSNRGSVNLANPAVNNSGPLNNNSVAPLTNTSGPRPLEPTLAPGAASNQPIRARVTKGTGTLPNDQNQQWREYDIRPYTSKVTTTNKPEQAIVDWILRDTGTETWFSDTLSLMHADRETLTVYHTPEMHSLVEGIVNRFVSSQAESHALSLRLLTVNSPNWRTRAMPLMRAVDVQSPGVEAWLLSKESAAVLLSSLRKRSDYQEHNSPNLILHNGQSHTITRTRPRSYMKSVNWQPTPQMEMSQIEEGYSVEISPLYSLDNRIIDAVIKCHIDQVEQLVPITLEATGATGIAQRFQVQVPQVVSWRLHERFRWPADQVLLLSCGVVASPGPEKSNPFGFPTNLFSGAKGRSDAILMIESKGKVDQQLPNQDRSARQVNPQYRGRY
ncbi:MAG: hypothetical protein ACI9HK_003849, partial [Pirellulaceae bacterium]